MNIMTDVMNRTYKALKDFDAHMKNSVTEPYGTAKLTEREQLDRYRSLTPEKMFQQIQSMSYKDFQDFNKWLYRMEQKEQKNARMVE